jgi:GNAT superfamily N-acetyltransferase
VDFRPRDLGVTFGLLSHLQIHFDIGSKVPSSIKNIKMKVPMSTYVATSLIRSQAYTITYLNTSGSILTHLPELCLILQDCVNEGSSIGFLAPLSLQEAEKYWTQVAETIIKGNLHLFILTTSEATPGRDTPPTILGTIQLSTIPKATHLHRAEVIKLLVSPSSRRLGIARKLMEYIEDFARGTATGSAAVEMYRRLGWEEWGTCKDYASWPDGSRCDATFFRKDLV